MRLGQLNLVFALLACGLSCQSLSGVSKLETDSVCVQGETSGCLCSESVARAIGLVE
jgi:hypothetical protein